MVHFGAYSFGVRCWHKDVGSLNEQIVMQKCHQYAIGVWCWHKDVGSLSEQVVMQKCHWIDYFAVLCVFILMPCVGIRTRLSTN